METVSVLDFHKIPEIRSHIHSAEILTLDSKHEFKPYNFLRIFIMISGSATYKAISNDKAEKGKTFSSNYILVLPSNNGLELNITTQQCQLLYITFELYATHNLLDKFNENENPAFNYKKLNLLRECNSVTSYEDQYPYFQSDVHNLIHHYKTAPSDLKGLSMTLETVLYTMIRVQFSTTINVLRAVKAVAVTANKYQFKTPFNFSISDVSVWSHPKSNKSKSEKLCSFLAQHNFTELPTDKKSCNSVWVDDKEIENTPYCDFNLTDGDRFKLWLFPGIILPSLEEYKSTGVIRFRFKASQTGSFMLMLYHTPSYQCITYTFEITEPDVWTDFEILISKNSALNVLLPYVEKAVQYIQDNYAEKITIQDIANHVKIHPSYLSSIFRKSLNQSVNSYINFHRINVAKQLLKNGNTSITDIALQTGFYDAQHFLKTFKKNTGFTPSEYRNM